MFAGFNLSLASDSRTSQVINNYWATGRRIADSNKIDIKEKIDEFMLDNGSIDGSQMQDNWFPQVKADVFISHSHANENKAIALAGWLKEELNLNTFIDSCVWGYSNELLKKLDERYCKIQGKNSYYYELRNFSTSHVHMMLSTALMMMIDKTECILFLNTPESITSKSVIENSTNSPWIYHELAMTRMVRKKELAQYRPVQGIKKAHKTLDEQFSKSMDIQYRVNLKNLHDLSERDLLAWWNAYKTQSVEFSLDQLYERILKKFQLESSLLSD